MLRWSEKRRDAAPHFASGDWAMIQRMVPIAQFAVGTADTLLITIGLGSCVGIALLAPRQRIGALAHVLLPHAALSTQHPLLGKVPSSAVPAMLDVMRGLGAVGEIEGRLVGGASMFAPLLSAGAVSLGTRNVNAARAACVASGIPIVGEAVGGDFGRSVYFDVGAGRIVVRSVRGDDVFL